MAGTRAAVWRPAALVALLAAGCTASLPVAAREVLLAPLPESHLVSATPARVWDELLGEALWARDRRGARILVADRAAGVLSWIELTRGASAHDPSLSPQFVLHEPQQVPAITTVRLRAAPGGTSLSIRRVYYPGRSEASIAHSRGAFEEDLLRRLAVAP